MLRFQKRFAARWQVENLSYLFTGSQGSRHARKRKVLQCFFTDLKTRFLQPLALVRCLLSVVHRPCLLTPDLRPMTKQNGTAWNVLSATESPAPVFSVLSAMIPESMFRLRKAAVGEGTAEEQLPHFDGMNRSQRRKLSSDGSAFSVFSVSGSTVRYFHLPKAHGCPTRLIVPGTRPGGARREDGDIGGEMGTLPEPGGGSPPPFSLLTSVPQRCLDRDSVCRPPKLFFRRS